MFGGIGGLLMDLATSILKAVSLTGLDAAADVLGIPRRLERAIDRAPALFTPFVPPVPTVDMDSVVRWEVFAGPEDGGRLRPLHGSWPRAVRAMGALVRTETLEGWTCDIRRIEGLSASRSTLAAFATLDEFARKECRGYIAKGLEACLEHCETRIAKRGGYAFSQVQWDGERVFLHNSDGSHHFAAARYLARELRVPIELKGTSTRFSLDPVAVADLVQEYDLFASSTHGLYASLLDPLRALQAPCFLANAPPPFEKVVVLFFPRSSRRAARSAELLRRRAFFDVGRYLRALAGASLAETSLPHDKQGMERTEQGSL
jgi:hypothetical protein